MAGKKRKRLPNELAVDNASIAMLEKADADGVARDAFSRADAQGRACKVGLDGVCCRICHMGPCTISETRQGVCGATADTVAARNLLREVAAGAAAHSGHGRNLTLLLKAVGEGRGAATRFAMRRDYARQPGPGASRRRGAIRTKSREKSQISFWGNSRFKRGSSRVCPWPRRPGKESGTAWISRPPASIPPSSRRSTARTWGPTTTTRTS